MQRNHPLQSECAAYPEVSWAIDGHRSDGEFVVRKFSVLNQTAVAGGGAAGSPGQYVGRPIGVVRASRSIALIHNLHHGPACAHMLHPVR